MFSLLGNIVVVPFFIIFLSFEDSRFGCCCFCVFWCFNSVQFFNSTCLIVYFWLCDLFVFYDFCVLELKCYLTSLEAVAFVVRSRTIQCLNSKVLVWFSVIYENLGIPRSLLALCRFTRL